MQASACADVRHPALPHHALVVSSAHNGRHMRHVSRRDRATPCWASPHVQCTHVGIDKAHNMHMGKIEYFRVGNAKARANTKDQKNRREKRANTVDRQEGIPRGDTVCFADADVIASS